MSDDARNPTDAAPMVTADAGQNESALLRELVGDQEEEMGDASSGLPDLESGAEEEMDKKGTGRPNFVRAATGAGRRVESTQEFFRPGNKNRTKQNGRENDDNDNFFAAPRKSAMRGPRTLPLGGGQQTTAGADGGDPESCQGFR